MNCDQRSCERNPVLHDAGSPAAVCWQADAHRDRQWRAPLSGADSDSVLARAFSAPGVASERCKATNRPGLYPRSRSHASGKGKYFGHSTTRDMPRGARDRIGEDRAAAEQPHTPCSGARLRRRSATSTNEARLAGNARFSQRRCQLRLASRQQCFLQSPPEASPRRRERPAEAKARRPVVRCAARASNELVPRARNSRGMYSRYWRGSSYIQRATGSVANARTSLAIAWSISEAPTIVMTAPWPSLGCDATKVICFVPSF